MDKKKGINVLSLFDGMSCGQLALEEVGVKVNNYFSSEIDKHCNKLVKQKFPNTIQLGDITQLTEEELAKLPPIDLLIGGSPCFTGETLIYTNEGYKEIKDIKVGDFVLTHLNQFQRVLKIGAKKSQIVEFNAQCAFNINTTNNHPFYVSKRVKKWNNTLRKYDYFFNEPEWLPVEQINKEYFVLQNINNLEENPLNITKEEARLIGCYLADGHTRKDQRKEKGLLSFGLDKIEKLKDFFQDFTLNYNIYNYGENVKRVVFCNKRLTEIVEQHCGVNAKQKYLSPMLLNLPKDILKEIIEGYLFGNGCFLEKKKVYKLTSISNKLLLGIAQAILKVYGTHCNFSHIKKPKTCEILGGVYNQNDVYEIYFSKENKDKSIPFIKDGYLYSPFKSKSLKGEEYVYNLEVENDNSYTANNLIVHNCQGFSMAGKQLNFNDLRSKLFFDFVRVLKFIKPTYFLLENVVMKKEYEDIITDYLGVKPVLIDSALVSAQQRKRLYWANFNIIQPKEKQIDLEDVIDHTAPLKREIDQDLLNDLNQLEFKDTPIKDITDFKERFKTLNRASITGRRITLDGKRNDYDKSLPISQFLEVRNSNLNKSCCLTTVPKTNVLTCLPIGRYRDCFSRKLPYRYYSWEEMAKLQTVNPDYFKNKKGELIVSQSQIKQMLGNGWTVDVIAHIFQCLFENL